MVSIGTVLDRNRGIAPGFDLLRVALAVLVVVWHGRAIVHGDLSPGGRFFELGGYGIIAAFFSLSGFLVTGSAQRLPLPKFLVNRGLRLFPALAVEIVLSALVLGPMFTTLPLTAYASDGATHRYFANILGLISYILPGVFTDHPTAVVNTSLWTIPHEIVCYAILVVFVLCGALRRPAIVVACFGLFAALGFAVYLGGAARLPALPALVCEKFFVAKASRLYAGFLLGTAAYLYRYRLPYDRRLLALAIGVALAAGAFDLLSVQALPPLPLMNVLAMPAIVYVTVYLGVSDLPTPVLFRRGDYSYGIYLYGWPIQQTVLALMPSVTDTARQTSVAIPLVFLFAMLSWHAVERPTLGLRRNLSFIARRRLATGDAPVAASVGSRSI